MLRTGVLIRCANPSNRRVLTTATQLPKRTRAPRCGPLSDFLFLLRRGLRLPNAWHQPPTNPILVLAITGKIVPKRPVFS